MCNGHMGPVIICMILVLVPVALGISLKHWGKLIADTLRDWS